MTTSARVVVTSLLPHLANQKWSATPTTMITLFVGLFVYIQGGEGGPGDPGDPGISGEGVIFFIVLFVFFPFLYLLLFP